MPEYVFYHIQNEHCESEDVPNAFPLSPHDRIGPLSLGRFKELFFKAASGDSRLADSTQLHRLCFRFRLEDKKCDYLWLDVSSDDDTLPIYQNTIAVKVLNISDSATANAKSRLRLKTEGENATKQGITSKTMPPPKPGKKVPSSSSTSSSSTSKKNGDGLIEENHSFFDYNSNSSSHSFTPAVVDYGKSDLFNMTNNDYDPPPKSDTSPAQGSFADIDDSHSRSNNSSCSAIVDDGLSNSDYKARREQMIDDKVQAALDFKATIDENQRKESDELDAARAKLDKGLTVWAVNNKEKRNVRTLLSTMHTVLWPECTWAPCGLADVIDSKQVKLKYRKAMLVVHPDRCSGSSGEVRFIAKRVFEAINEAYQDFLKKESVE